MLRKPKILHQNRYNVGVIIWINGEVLQESSQIKKN